MITIFPRSLRTHGQPIAVILTSFCLARLLRSLRRSAQLKFTMRCVEMTQHFTHSSTTPIGRLKAYRVKNAFMRPFFFCCAWETTGSPTFLLAKMQKLAGKLDMQLIRKLTGTNIRFRRPVHYIHIAMCVPLRNACDRGESDGPNSPSAGLVAK